MIRRRSDTRERIQETALKLFTEKGYESTSLREIAEVLGVTKAALYYHFKTKEEIIYSIMSDLQKSFAELIEWAKSIPQTLDSRKQMLRELFVLLKGRWRPLILFAQANQNQLKSMRHPERRLDEIREMFSVIGGSEADSVKSYHSMVAVAALVIASFPNPLLPDPDADLSEVAFDIAFDLISR
ncbi:MAG TPA: TetR/AcrR family transcriptional regulator [Spirochaetia bacterium]|nr:TetR/AcrR family transcriptional regulator [Spirochaetia bacterium]